MDRSSNRLAFGVMIAAFVVAAAFLMNYDAVKIFNIPIYAFFAFLIALVLFLMFIVSLLKEGK